MVLISIIIPIYNAEKSIKECIESIISQTYKNIEIICINDGSTDNSLNIIEEYANKDKRIKIYSQENKGPGSARNLGILKATGGFICFVDIDDCFIDDNALMNLVLAQRKCNSDLVVGKISVTDSNTREQIKIRGWDNLKSHVIYNCNNLYNKIYQCISPSCFSKLYKSELLLENNIFFTSHKASEDMLFVYTYILNCKNFICIDNIIIRYMVLQKNSLSSFNSNFLLDGFEAYKILANRISDKKLGKLLRKTLIVSYIYYFIYVLKRVSFRMAFMANKKFLIGFVNLLN